VEREAVGAEVLPDAVKDEVLQDVEIEVNQRRVLVGLLQAAWVVGNREAVYRVRQHRAEDDRRLVALRLEDVDRPDRVAPTGTERGQEQLPAHEPVNLPT